MSEISVGQGAVLPDDFVHGSDCSVGPYAVVGSGCVIEVVDGPRATVVASESTLLGAFPGLVVQSGASIGAECAQVYAGLELSDHTHTRIEPGAVVNSDVPPHAAVVAGNPAYVTGYVSPSTGDSGGPTSERWCALRARRGRSFFPAVLRSVGSPEVADLRGLLTFAEVDGRTSIHHESSILVYDVPSQELRGEHAHHRLHQLIIAVSGAV